MIKMEDLRDDYYLETCSECNGTGCDNKSSGICYKCKGKGKINWVDNVMGPKESLFSFTYSDAPLYTLSSIEEAIRNKIAKELADKIDQEIIEKIHKETEKIFEQKFEEFFMMKKEQKTKRRNKKNK